MIPTEDVRLAHGAGTLCARWHFPAAPACAPFPSVLLLTDWPPLPDSFLAEELLSALTRAGIAVLQLREACVEAGAVPTLLHALREHHLASKVRLGAVVSGRAAQTLPPLTDSVPFLRVEFRPKLAAAEVEPETEELLRAAAEWQSARSLAAEVQRHLVPAWEMQARRPGTAIG